MKWNDILDRNLQSALIWASVALILLITSLIENKRFTDLEQSITSVYENRLVAKGYLYKMNSMIKLKESRAANGQANDDHRSINDSINTLFVMYANTELTEEESNHLERLKSQMHDLFTMASGQDQRQIYQSIFAELELLAAIQIKEGKKLVEQSTTSVLESRIVTGIEAFFLAGLIIYSFQFFSRKRFGNPKKEQLRE